MTSDIPISIRARGTDGGGVVKTVNEIDFKTLVGGGPIRSNSFGPTIYTRRLRGWMGGGRE